MSCVVRKTFALTFCVWRHTLHPEGKCTETPHRTYIGLDTLHPEDTRCIQKANALTLLI